MREKSRSGTPGGLVVAVTALLVSGAATVVVAGVSVLAAVMARRIVTPAVTRSDDTDVLGVDLEASTITLAVTPDSVLPGDYSFWFERESGHARLGEILRVTKTAVTRRIDRVDYGDLSEARRGRLGGYSYLGPWDLGLPFEQVQVQTELGPAPAWLLPAERPDGRWVIQVHGRGVRRQETLRAVPVFHDSGYTCLLVSYRNDGDAPESGDGRYGLGDTEWHDIDAAVGFAAGRGATSVVLMGWSMGGAIVLQTATRTAFPQLVSGIVLDSPVIDWADVVAYQGSTLRLPGLVATGAMQVLGRRWGGRLTGQSSPIDFRRLDFVTRADDLELPVLLMHSDDDGYVPSSPSRALAVRRPDIVTFLPFTVARHTKLWNYDREGWNAAIETWLGELRAGAEPAEPDDPAHPAG
ncbi:alpha/beta fold hydrolase [Cryobacterium breve]|uniref:Alpha/beta fold hydrolase n=1 Tax=Cryobacterium breve TaxID=1259258 RepID=A0ABY7ND89_9MICO|nr:alpha/beta fold hydrolase [Cryobacterium breve]WBM80476.1 alpha/beta fold hydrolase [Cryobacterium breve]